MPKGGQLGNKNATKNKPWIGALNKAIAQGDAERLRNIAEKLLKAAEEGEPWAIKELADRLDGRSVQPINASIDATARVIRLK